MNRMFNFPHRWSRSQRMNGSHTFLSLVGLALSLGLAGCISNVQRPALTESRDMASADSLQLVGDLARPWGLKWLEVGGVTLTVGLDGTGSSPAPSEDYKMLISEMRVRDVERPDAVLGSPSTAMTLVRAMIPPGAQKGDRVDVEVRVPAKSKTSSLEGGWMMLTRLKEFARVNGRLSSGHVIAMGQGNILVDSILEGSEDPVLMTRGRILGGGVITQSRELGLRIRDENLSVRTSAKVGEMINRRFHIYDQGAKQGVANPKKDSFISLVVHPRYRENLLRYIRVIENIPVRESNAGLVQRLQVLQSRLLDPDTSSIAAVQLEAIGEDAVPVLLEGAKNVNAEVQFYSAEALAYLDQGTAASILSGIIRDEPAFRWRALRALGAMDDLSSQEELAMLMREDSAEIRYGSFRTLLNLTPDDPIVRGEVLGDEFRLHTVEVASKPMVHVSKSDHPEIVIFGESVSLNTPVVAFAGKDLVIRSTEDGRIRVRRLAVDDTDDRQVIVDTKLPSVIRAVVELGGGYSDVVHLLSESRASGALECRLESGAVPQPGRKLYREERGGIRDAGELAKGASVGVPSMVDEDSRRVAQMIDQRASRPGSNVSQLGAVDVLPPVVDAINYEQRPAVSEMAPPVFEDDFEGDVGLEDRGVRVAIPQATGGAVPVSESIEKPMRIVVGDDGEGKSSVIRFDRFDN